MMVNSKCKDIENCFLLLRSGEDKTAISTMESKLKELFHYDFTVRFITPKSSDKFFLMSVFPERDAIHRMITVIASGATDQKVIQSLWETNKQWTIEIDSRVLDSKMIEFSESELAALLLHEVGHIINSNAISTRVSNILQYKISTMKSQDKASFKNSVISSILEIPFMKSCLLRKENSNVIRNEILADNFVERMGYRKPLIHAMDKILMSNKIEKDSLEDDFDKSLGFTSSTLDALRERRAKAARLQFSYLKESCDTPYMKDIASKIESNIFYTDKYTNSDKISSFVERFIEESTSDHMMMEFFGIGPKKMKPISGMELDYISMRINSMKTESDRMLIVSYIHTKLDLVNYYISLKSIDPSSKKYSIPHSENELLNIKSVLEEQRKEALGFKIPEKEDHLYVKWVKGYEG